MSKRLLALALALLCALSVAIPIAAQQPDAAPPTPQPQATVAARLAQTPALFIENVGQFDKGARYQVWGGPGTTWLAQDAVWVSLLEPASRTQGPQLLERGLPGSDENLPAEPRRGVNLRLSFEGANPAPPMESFAPAETVVSYFRGSDLDQWRPDVPVWGGVRYVDLYPGLDLEVHGEAGRWGWRIVAKTATSQRRAALSAVRLRVEGAEDVRVEGGSLALQTAVGPLALPLLGMVDAAGAPLRLSGVGPQVRGDIVAAPFAPPQETGRGLTNDPTSLVYSTFWGGRSHDYIKESVTDDAGRLYIVGGTHSDNYPTTPGAYDTTLGSPHYASGYCDLFVAALNATGSALLYSTFLGGWNHEYVGGIAVDGEGQAYVTGNTATEDYPTTPGAYDTSFDIFHYTEGFVTALNATGSALVYSTFLAGSYEDTLEDITVDEAGRAYVTGSTQSADYPATSGAYDTSFDNDGFVNAVVSVLNPSGSALVYSTFLGARARGHAITVDEAGCAYVAGLTGSSDYPTTLAAYDTSFNGGSYDAFVTALNATGSALLYSTFLGGISDDWCVRIIQDSEGCTYVTGYTGSADYPTTSGAYDTGYNGGSHDAFVTALNATGSALLYSTFLGGNGDDAGLGITQDSEGCIYVAGKTGSADYPTTSNAYDTSYNGGDVDAFVTALNATGSALLYSTFLGGNGSDGGTGIMVDGEGYTCVSGSTQSVNYPVTLDAYDTRYDGSCDGFITVLLPTTLLPTPTATPPPTATPTATPAPITQCWVSPGEERVYRVPVAAFVPYDTEAASDSTLRRITAPPAPVGWNLPSFQGDDAWESPSAVWWPSWAVGIWARLPEGASPIGVGNGAGQQLGETGLTLLYRRTFTLTPPVPGWVVMRAHLETWSDNKAEWWWQGTSVATDRQGYGGVVALYPDLVQAQGGEYTLAVQNSNDLQAGDNPQGTAYRLCVTWSYQANESRMFVMLPIILKP